MVVEVILPKVLAVVVVEATLPKLFVVTAVAVVVLPKTLVVGAELPKIFVVVVAGAVVPPNMFVVVVETPNMPPEFNFGSLNKGLDSPNPDLPVLKIFCTGVVETVVVPGVPKLGVEKTFPANSAPPTIGLALLLVVDAPNPPKMFVGAEVVEAGAAAVEGGCCDLEVGSQIFKFSTPVSWLSGFAEV